MPSTLEEIRKGRTGRRRQKGGEEKLQKIHDKFIKRIDDMLAAKDKEIMTV